MSFIIQEQASPVLFEIGKEEPTGAGGVIDFYLNDQDYLYFQGAASGNFSLDITFDAATTLNDALNVDDLVTVTLAVTNGDANYYLQNLFIDGGTGVIDLVWQGGEPKTGFADEVNYYTFKILKTSGDAYTVFASLTKTPGFSGAETIAAGAAGEIDFFLSEQTQLIYTNPASGNYSLNVKYASGTPLNEILGVNESITISLRAYNGAVGHYMSGISIDDTRTNIQYAFQNGLFSAGTTSSIMDYSIDIVKTASGQFTIFAKEDDLDIFVSVPDAPVSVSASIVNPSACEITFTDSPGLGYPTLNYTVVSSPSGITATATASPIVLSGLTPSGTYAFQVFATNTIGDSLLSGSSNSVLMVQDPPSTIEVVMIAGGGGGGVGQSIQIPPDNRDIRGGGGGGAGGLVYSASVGISTATVYPVGIGTGGAAQANGTNTTGFSLTAAVGGGKGGDVPGTAPAGSGGSGGGGGLIPDRSPGAGTSGQGFPGLQGGENGGGGGGYYTGVGGGVTASLNGVGTSAYSTWLAALGLGHDVSGTYWIGGGGRMNAGPTANSGYPIVTSPRTNGGGGYNVAPLNPNSNGLANTGSGGAGTVLGAAGTSQGGSGLLMLRYPAANREASVTTGSPSTVVSGGYRYYAFTGTGTIRWD